MSSEVYSKSDIWETFSMKNYIFQIHFTLYILVIRLLPNHFFSLLRKYISNRHCYSFASHIILYKDIAFHSAYNINILVFSIESIMYQNLEWLSLANRKLFFQLWLCLMVHKCLHNTLVCFSPLCIFILTSYSWRPFV